MSNKQQTALQQAIKELKKISTKGGMMVQSVRHQIYAEGKEQGIDIALKILESMLELEKQQLKDAFLCGDDAEFHGVRENTIMSFKQYYNETYEH